MSSTREYLNARAFSVYGRLTILRVMDSRHVECSCSCGSPPKMYTLHNLRSGNSKSCGCFAKEERKLRKKHGQAHSQVYQVWCEMRRRCGEPASPSYPAYGGRGIKVCDRWESSFEDFISDMGPRPPGTSLDRRDNDKGYSPENCRWATRIEQARNTRANVFLEHDGQKLTLVEWAETKGMGLSTLHSRLTKLGWSTERALTTPIKSAGWRTYQGARP